MGVSFHISWLEQGGLSAEFTGENQEKVKEGEQGKRRDNRFESHRAPQLAS